jgi:hypothetical protein
VANQPPANRPPANGNGNGNYNRPPANGNGNGNYNRPANGNGNYNRPPGGYHPPPGGYPPRPPRPPGGYPAYRPPNTIIVNPGYRGPAWGWNGGVIWAPAYNYWGGGFWGPFAVGVTSAYVFGSIVSSTTHETVTSYQVQPDSPGATLLKNYSLTQTTCEAEDIVVIYGPQNSVICAYPNQYVAAGTYDLDPSKLTITSR